MSHAIHAIRIKQRVYGPTEFLDRRVGGVFIPSEREWIKRCAARINYNPPISSLDSMLSINGAVCDY